MLRQVVLAVGASDTFRQIQVSFPGNVPLTLEQGFHLQDSTIRDLPGGISGTSLSMKRSSLHSRTSSADYTNQERLFQKTNPHNIKAFNPFKLLESWIFRLSIIMFSIRAVTVRMISFPWGLILVVYSSDAELGPCREGTSSLGVHTDSLKIHSCHSSRFTLRDDIVCNELPQTVRLKPVSVASNQSDKVT